MQKVDLSGIYEIITEVVSDYVEKEQENIAWKIAEKVDSYRSPYKYERFCSDGKFVVNDILCLCDGHLAVVCASGEITEGYLSYTTDGPWPSDDTYNVDFNFKVDIKDGTLAVTSFAFDGPYYYGDEEKLDF